MANNVGKTRASRRNPTGTTWTTLARNSCRSWRVILPAATATRTLPGQPPAHRRRPAPASFVNR